MLRRILIASAAAAMLLVTFTPDDADARGRGGGGYRGGGGGYRGGAVAGDEARSRQRSGERARHRLDDRHRLFQLHAVILTPTTAAC